MCNGAARGLTCALAAAATLAWSAAPVQAQGLSLKGRVLDRAVRKPVPGATVRLISGTGPAAMTDDQGRFALDADVSAARVPPPLGELPTPPGRRTFSPVPAWEAAGAWRDAAGRIRAWGLPPLGVKSGPGTNGSPEPDRRGMMGPIWPSPQPSATTSAAAASADFARKPRRLRQS